MITKENVALMYHAPGRNREFNAFALDKSYYGPFDETTCIDWTDDSKYVTALFYILECRNGAAKGIHFLLCILYFLALLKE